MKIVSRLSMSADGYVSTPDGWPSQLADPAFVSRSSHGIVEFLEGKEAALMGATTFAPALGAERWPWPGLDVFVLGSARPEGTPDEVVVDHDPAALDELQLVVLPILLGAGLRLTDHLDPATQLTFTTSRPLTGGSVEITYEV